MTLIPERFRRRRGRDQESTMTLVEHLEELRNRLFISLGAIAVAAIGGWFLYEPVLDLLQEPFCKTIQSLPPANRPATGCRFIFLGAIDAVVIKLKVIVFLGLLIALPIVLYQLWAFIVPGLTKRERRMAVPFVVSSVLLFALGAVLAYLTLPRGLGFLLGFAGPAFVPQLTGDKFLGFVMLLTLAFGLSFEFPIALIFLSIAGVVSSQQMREWRRRAIMFIAVFAAVITPSADPYTMLALMIPMVLFYEAAIIVARLLKR
ncbi:MAG: twin-arginine translocase subunit TatC [Actinomycetota bacterium]